MIIGMLMGQETCRILGQVSPNIYSIRGKTARRINVVQGEINEKTADIQARSFMARNLENNGKAKLKEKQKWSNEKLHLDIARKLRGINFSDPEDKEIQRNHQECS